MAVTPASHLGPYEILSGIGSGGMGEVFLARDTRLDRRVAIKVLRQDVVADDVMRKRLEREAVVLSRLNHPNVAAVYDVGSHEGTVYLVMEYIPGSTMNDLLVNGPVAERDLVRLGVQLVEGLAAAHGESIIHRDLKPKNLRITPEGRLKILDFGLARVWHSQVDDETIEGGTGDDTAAGTVPYMAPEQLLGRPTDNRADIYAAGLVLYEMATGRRAFPERQGAELTDAILHRIPVSANTLNRHISPALSSIIDKALEKDPARRHQSARELLVDFERLSVTGAFAVLGGRRSAVRAAAVLLLAVTALVGATLVWKLGGWRDRTAGRPTVAEIRSIAVLPLANVSNDPSQDYFSDGLTDELIATLGRVSALRVISRTSVMQFRAPVRRLPDIAHALNVDAVLEGSVLVVPARPGGAGHERVRIIARLIQPASDTSVWSGTFEKDLVDVLSLQEEIARAVATEIKVAISPQERERLSGSRPVDPEAYKRYLMGREAWNRRTREDLRRAVESFHLAIEKAPDFAPAYAGLADAYVLLRGNYRAVPIERATEAATKAIELDDRSAEGHTALAFAKFYLEWDWTRAEREFKRAIELNQNYATAHNWYANYLTAMTRTAEAISETRKAEAIDPLSLIIRRDRAWPYFFAGRYDEAIGLLREALSLDASFLPVRTLLGRAYIQNRMFDAGIKQLEAVTKEPDGAEYADMLAHAYAAAGRRDAAEALLTTLLGQSEPPPPYQIGLIYAALGRKREALDWFERAYGMRDSTLVNLKADPRLEPLHSDPRFRSLLARMAFPP
jgi:TolB-like protein